MKSDSQPEFIRQISKVNVPVRETKIDWRVRCDVAVLCQFFSKADPMSTTYGVICEMKCYAS